MAESEEGEPSGEKDHSEGTTETELSDWDSSDSGETEPGNGRSSQRMSKDLGTQKVKIGARHKELPLFCGLPTVTQVAPDVPSSTLDLGDSSPLDETELAQPLHQSLECEGHERTPNDLISAPTKDVLKPDEGAVQAQQRSKVNSRLRTLSSLLPESTSKVGFETTDRSCSKLLECSQSVINQISLDCSQDATCASSSSNTVYCRLDLIIKRDRFQILTDTLVHVDNMRQMISELQQRHTALVLAGQQPAQAPTSEGREDLQDLKVRVFCNGIEEVVITVKCKSSCGSSLIRALLRAVERFDMEVLQCNVLKSCGFFLCDAICKRITDGGSIPPSDFLVRELATSLRPCLTK